MNQHKARLAKLRQSMASAGTQALVVTHLPDVRYLSGFTGSNAALAITGRRATLFTDGRYTTQAREETPYPQTGIRTVIGKQVAREAAAALYTPGVTIQYSAGHTSVAELAAMEAALPGTLTVAARRKVFRAANPYQLPVQREIKDQQELVLMEHAALLGCQLFESIQPNLEPGKPEREVAAELEFLARSLGADGMSFDTIVASGPRSAMPHGVASGQKLPRNGFVTLDFGVVLNGYCSDMTRTVHLGRPSREARAAYEAVLEAQENAVAAVRPGAMAGEVDEAARSVLRRYKLAKYFTHSTGHGVGIEIHEGPRIASNQAQLLQPGMVITIEPGIYLPGRFGIRIEDMVAVSQTGSKVLTSASPKALITL